MFFRKPSTSSSSNEAKEPYIKLYPTQFPEPVLSMQLRMLARHQEELNASTRGLFLRQNVYRITAEQVERNSHLYTAQERLCIEKGYLYYQAPASAAHPGLELSRQEYQDFCGALSSFCLDGSTNPDRSIFRPGAQEKPLHTFLSFYDRNTVFNGAAFKRTVDDVAQLKKSGREQELIHFMNSKHPTQNLPRTWRSFTELLDAASAADGSIASVRA